MLNLSDLEHEDCEEYMQLDIFTNEAFMMMQNIRKQGKLCDVTLKVDTSKFSAHRIVLAASIPYFNSMFTSDMLEVNKNEIIIQGIEEHALEALVNYAYSGCIAVNVNTVQAILIGANFLQLKTVKEFCASFIIKRLHPSNCLGVRQFGEMLMCASLIDRSNRYLNKHFIDVAQSEEFMQLSKDHVIDILSRSELNVPNEEQVFNAATGWIKHDFDSRNDFMPELLQHIRLPLLRPEFLTDVVQMDPAAESCLKCRDLVDKAKDYHLMPDRRSLFPPEMIQPRYCSEILDVIYAVGGVTSAGEALNTVEKYTSNNRHWETVSPMKICRSRVGVAVFEGKLYAIGGFDGTNRLDSAEVYDPETDEWSIIPSMKERRSALGCVAFESQIFVCGGYDGLASLNSCEVFNPEKKTWLRISTMNKSRSAGAVCVFEGSIFIFGGHDGLSIFSSVERYDRRQDKWNPGTSMLSRRCRHGVACFEGRIFVFGGYDGQKFLKTAEMYDRIVDQWTAISSMSMRRSRVGVAVSGGKIYALGGYDGCSNLSSVEVYDPEKNKWHESDRMGAHEGGVGVGAIPPSSSTVM